MIAIGTVVSIEDNLDGERVKVEINPQGKIIPEKELAYAFPLLPKMFHVKPKVGEYVFVLFDNDNEINSQRYYIGPIISQPQFFEHQTFGATALLRGGIEANSPVRRTSEGAFSKDDDIAILGRKNSDIILSDNDLRIRCGVHELENRKISFNTINPAFIKLKFYPKGLFHNVTKNQTTIDMSKSKANTYTECIGSTATIIADKINLLSNNGDPHFNISDKNESISDEEMLKILDKAHQLPYGDILCEFLSDFLKMFKEHVHNYHNKPVEEDDNVKAFNRKYGSSKGQLSKKLLSENISIN